MAEKQLYRGRTALRNSWFLILCGGIIIVLGLAAAVGTPQAGAVPMFLMVLVGLAFVGVAYLRRFGTEFVVTSEHVRERRGIISRHTSEVGLSDVRNVQVHQGVFQRVFGVGDVQGAR